jgi:hypothetical protein
VRRAIPQTIGHRGGGRAEPRGLGGSIGFLCICCFRDVDNGQSPRPDDRRVLDAGDHRDTV